MAFDAHKNFAYSTVATAPSPASSGASLIVQAGDGAKFPAAPFNASVWPVTVLPTTGNAEIVRVTNVSGDTITITRTQEGSNARAITVGDQIAATVTAKTLTDVETRNPSFDNIQFPAAQASSSDVNNFDDYEEGDFTPVIGGDGGTSGQAYSSQIGKYVKKGKEVTAYGVVTLSTKGTITGNVQIQGLPFASENIAGINVAGLIAFFSGMGTNWINLGWYIGNNVTAGYIVGRQSAGAASAFLVTADITNTSSFVFSITYRATA